MWRIEGICVSVTRGLQGRQRQEFELRLSYSSGGTNPTATHGQLEALLPMK
jgi:hypothetical protein